MDVGKLSRKPVPHRTNHLLTCGYMMTDFGLSRRGSPVGCPVTGRRTVRAKWGGL